MGCCSEKMMAVRNKYNQMILSEEEAVITMKEKQIPFSSIKLKDLDTSIRKNQNCGVLSIAQFRKVLTELGFELEVFTSPEEYMFKFLQILQNQNHLYEEKTVMLYGVVLCGGSPREKSEILFRLFDSRNLKSATKNEVERMIEQLIEISAEKIPLIAIDDNEEPQTFTLPEAKIKNYIQSMVGKKEIYKTRVSEMLMGNRSEISMNEFMRKVLSEPLLEALLWSYLIRQCLVD